MNIQEIHNNYIFKEQRRHLSTEKLKAVLRTSALLSGFAMVSELLQVVLSKKLPKIFIQNFSQVAIVEVSLDDYKYSKTSIPLIIIYLIITCLVVGVHLLALMISSCILPLLDSDSLISYEEHEALHIYIEFAWILSTGIGKKVYM